jgi:hypothetical protein
LEGINQQVKKVNSPAKETTEGRDRQTHKNSSALRRVTEKIPENAQITRDETSAKVGGLDYQIRNPPSKLKC